MRKNTIHPRGFARPLADLVSQTIDPVMARRGFGQSHLVTYWDEIVGERLAAMSQPIELRWPQRTHAPDGKTAAATLLVRVEGGFALELQHSAGLVIERVNAFFGWRCVSRLALKQGPVARTPRTPRHRSPEPEAARAAAALVHPIQDEALRQALERLGAHVLTRLPGESDCGRSPAAVRGSERENSFDISKPSSSFRRE
jgi:hypothetical protein